MTEDDDQKTQILHFEGTESDRKDDVIERLMDLVMENQKFDTVREMFDFIVEHHLAMKIVLRRWMDDEDTDDIRRIFSSIFFPLLG